MTKLFSAAFSLLLLAGCASTSQSVKGDFSFQANGNTGLVVVSTRLVDDCAPSLKPLDRIAAMNLNFHGSQGSDSIGFFILRNPLISTDFENPDGYFYVRELPVGHYTITDFSREGGTFFSTAVDKPLQFDVKRGAVRYLGEVTVNIQKCKDSNATQRAVFKISDQRKRDGQLFNTRMAKLSSKNFEYAILRK